MKHPRIERVSKGSDPRPQGQARLRRTASTPQGGTGPRTPEMALLKRAPAGFTLLELAISLVILATLTTFTTRSIQQALFSKEKIQTQVDEMSQVRDALKIIERDVNLAFHYRDMETEIREAIKKGGSTTPTPPPGQQPGFGGVFAHQNVDLAEQLRIANRADPVTQFEGSASEMSFATMNTGRVSQDEVRADFIKVGYVLKSCKRMGGKQEATQCLIRRDSPYVEGDITKGGSETVLLENVTAFTLRYFGKGKQDWNTTWSTKANDAVTKGAYPNAVEIGVTVENGEGAKKRKISMQIVAQVRFPNNEVKQGQTGTGALPP